MFKKVLMMAGATVIAVTAAGGATSVQAAATAPVTASADQGAVIITARKRSENLQRVPIAVTAQSGKQLEEKHIEQATDLAKFVPSMIITVSFSDPNAAMVTLRGQAAGSDLLSFAPAVGYYEDSVNIPHPLGTNLGLVDLSRIEVLKGPQGTLYGKNTTGGAINFITRGADYDGIHGYLQGEYGNYNDGKITGAVNVPLLPDVLAVRLAGQYWTRDGYGKSNVTGQHMGGDHNDGFFRASVRFDPLSNLSSSTKFEYDISHQAEVLDTLRYVIPNSTAALEAGIEAADASNGVICPLPIFPGTNIGAIRTCGNTLIQNSVSHNLFVNSDQAPKNRTDTEIFHFVEDLNWAITPDLSLRSITGAHKVTAYRVSDDDDSPYQLVSSDIGSNGIFLVPSVSPPGVTHQFPFKMPPDLQYTAWSQEFDLSGHAYDRLDWLVGLFGQTDSGDSGQGDGAAPAASSLFGGCCAITGSIVPNITQTTWGAYTQEDFHASDRVSFTLGARYSEEAAHAVVDQIFFNANNGVFYCPVVIPPPPGSPPGTLPTTVKMPTTPNNTYADCPVASHLASSAISYLASFNFQITPTEFFYIKTSRGNKGGTLQQRAPDFPAAKPEFSTDYEVGLKSQLFDRRLTVNVDAYLTNYTNKQVGESLVSPTNGTLEDFTVNAASAKIQGFEGDFNANPFPGLSLYGTVSYTDGYYVHYGPTPAPTYPFPCDPAINHGGPPTTACPLGGFPLTAAGQGFTVPWQYSLGGRYEHDLGPGQLAGELDWTYQGGPPRNNLSWDYLVPPAIHKQFFEGVGLLNGRIDYAIPQEKLTFSVFATNLLNKHYQTGALDLLSSFGYITGLTQAPAMFGIQVRKAFGNE